MALTSSQRGAARAEGIGRAASYYAATAVGRRERATLRGDTRADVCVIGGGYTGSSSALHLAERGYDVVLVEAECLGWGASGRNGGQLGSGQRKDVLELEAAFGEARAQTLWRLGEEAKAAVKQRIGRHGIACDLKPGVLTVAHKPADAPYLARVAERLRTHYGYAQARAVPREEVAEMLGTARYHGGLLDSDAAHLHPLNYALGLARAAEDAGARLFERSPVRRLRAARPGVEVVLESGSVRARYAVLACNGYLAALEPRAAAKIMPISNFLLATAVLPEALARSLIRDDVAVADTKFVVDYYRLSADRRLLFGGGERYTHRLPADIGQFVRRYMLRVFPQLADTPVEYAWGGTLAITRTRLPSFGRLDGDIYYAQGFSGHGVALTTLAGKLIAEAIAGTAERFDVFAGLPQPDFPGGTLLRWPALVLAMLYYSLRDKL